MKKIIIAILISLFSLPVFSVGIIVDSYMGQANGVDVGVFFGKGKALTSLGLTMDSRTILIDPSSSHGSSSSSSSSYDNNLSYDPYTGKYYSDSSSGESTKRKKETVENKGLFVRFDWVSNFLTLGFMKMGVDLGAQTAFSANSYSGFDISISLLPMLNVNIGNFNLTTGYKGTFYMADAGDSSVHSAPFKSSFAFGGSYRFGKGQAQSQGGKGNSNTPITGIDTSSNPTVIVLPSSNSVTQ